MFRHTMKENDLRVEESKKKETEKSKITNTWNFQYMHQVSNNYSLFSIIQTLFISFFFI